MKRRLLILCPLLLAGSPQPATPPQPLKMLLTAADYPEAAREAGVEGDVAFDLLIDEKGKVTGCEITAGGALPAAMAADSCTVAQKRWRFAPARNEAGQKIPGRLPVSIAWRISRRCPPPDGHMICVFL